MSALPLGDRVRNEVIAQQLGRHLPPRPGRAVDLGAGFGDQGLRLARGGWEVVLVDVDGERLATAATDAVTERVSDRVVTVEADVADLGAVTPELAGHLRPATADVVCAHALLPFLSTPGPLLTTMVSLVRPGGLLSVVTKNRSALGMRAGIAGRFDEALAVLGRGVEIRDDGTELVAHDHAEVVGWVTAAGASPVAHYGVGVFTAHRDDVVEDEEEVRAAVTLELAVATCEPYRSVARLHHLLAVRAP